MTKKITEGGFYYECDLCHTKILPNTGFSFPPNALGIEHTHQTCHYNKVASAKGIIKKFGKQTGMTDKQIKEFTK